MTAAALADVKILDFMWVMAGPAATRVLADYGATVVRVESTRRIDTARTLAPYRGGALGTNNSGCYQNLNAGKRMLTLDPTCDAGRRYVSGVASKRANGPGWRTGAPPIGDGTSRQ